MNFFKPSKFILSRVGLWMAFAFGLLGTTAGQSRAETLTFPLDNESAFFDVLHTFTNLAPNTTLSFKLVMAQPHGNLNLSSMTFDVLLADSSFASSVTFDGSASTAGTKDYHSIDVFLSEPQKLFDETLWQVNLGSSLLSSVSVVFSSFFSTDLNATLTVTTDGTFAAETPLPGALPLFAGGLGALVLITKRRRSHIPA